ncbi:MAG: ZIP family metal transporter [Anaerolineales bacterium]|nr:ZIP family metal transporter [Anaerolineales bacterium]
MITGWMEALVAALITMLATGLGAVPFLFIRKFPERISQMGWAFAGGMMLSASVFNLIIPAVEFGGITRAGLGMLLGTLVLGWAAGSVGGIKFELEGVPKESSSRVLLVLGTLFLHSFPEGMAVGVAYASGEIGLGLIMTMAIAIHNIPEGIAVSLPLRASGVSGWRCMFWAIVSSLPQPLAAVPAYLAVVSFRPLLPFAFGLAAGAMFYVVLSEMIPESRADETQRQSSALAAMTGFLLMMALQNVLVSA